VLVEVFNVLCVLLVPLLPAVATWEVEEAESALLIEEDEPDAAS